MQTKREWVTVETKHNEKEIYVDQLEPNTKYIFKVVGHCASGNSMESDESDVISTKLALCSKPGKPIPTDVKQDKIRLRWSSPKKCSEYVILYYVYYRLHNDKKKDGP